MMVRPLKLSFRLDNLNTCNDFQKLLGDIAWLRPYLKLTTAELRPLFDILKGDIDLSSKRSLTPEPRQAITLVQQRLESCQITRRDPDQPLLLIILPDPHSPTAIIWQGGPLQNFHLPSSPSKTLQPYPEAVALLLQKGLKDCLATFGSQPHTIITLYGPDQINWLINHENKLGHSPIHYYWNLR